MVDNPWFSTLKNMFRKETYSSPQSKQEFPSPTRPSTVLPAPENLYTPGNKRKPRDPNTLGRERLNRAKRNDRALKVPKFTQPFERVEYEVWMKMTPAERRAFNKYGRAGVPSLQEQLKSVEKPDGE